MISSHYNRTRIAPTPSGFLHLGNIMSFSINAALARNYGAKILLRIDDLDQARVTKVYVHDIFETLDFLQIPWNEGPVDEEDFTDNYSQVHRMGGYHSALKKLSDDGLVFGCTCSRQQINNGAACTCYEKNIPLQTGNISWRLFTGEKPEVYIKRLDGAVQPATLPDEMHNFIVRKKDGYPAYQLTSVVDDLFYGIDMVVRGQDLWPSTIAQHILAKALGKENIFGSTAFYHHPLIMETNGRKLSKSEGALSIKYLRENGRSPAEIFMQAGEIAGIKGYITNWEQLADAILNHKS